MLAPAFTSCTLADIKAQEASGGRLFAVTDETGAAVVALFLRIDELTERKEGVIVGAGGGLSGVDLTAEVLPGIEDIFRQAGCTSMRIHTERTGLVKKLAKQNYTLSEIVLTKEI